VGHITQRVRLQNPSNGRSATEISLIDTGATDTVIPQHIAGKLKLPELGRTAVETAKGKLRLAESVVRIKIRDRSKIVPVLISPGVRTVLIGVTTLETLAFNLDLAKRRLVKTRLLLYRALTRARARSPR
jgi:clan AA aspartic protease